MLQHFELSATDEVLELIDRYFPDEPISERSRLLLEDVLATLAD